MNEYLFKTKSISILNYFGLIFILISLVFLFQLVQLLPELARIVRVSIVPPYYHQGHASDRIFLQFHLLRRLYHH